MCDGVQDGAAAAALPLVLCEGADVSRTEAVAAPQRAAPAVPVLGGLARKSAHHGHGKDKMTS